MRLTQQLAIMTHPTTEGKDNTYKRQFRDDNSQGCKEIDGEIRQVVVGIMCAKQEETNGHAEEELLCGRILISIVDLLPHVEVVVRAGVEFKRDAPHPVEHEERTEHVADVGECP